MPNEGRPVFQLSLAEAQLCAPETPQYLEVALRLLETRLRELQRAGPVTVRSRPVQLPEEVDIPQMPQQVQPEPAPAGREAPRRRARWFQDQLPRITLEDGSQTTPRSLEDLKRLLQSRGLTPHPRGDASMLLWQVRNRLRGSVEVVDAEASG